MIVVLILTFQAAQPDTTLPFGWDFHNIENRNRKKYTFAGSSLAKITSMGSFKEYLEAATVPGTNQIPGAVVIAVDRSGE